MLRRPASSPVAHKYRFFLLIISALVCLLAPTLVTAYNRHASPLYAAWEQVRTAGSYSYDTDAQVVTTPDNRLENSGLNSTTERFTMVGDLNLTERSMQFKLWTGDGNRTNAASAIELRSINGVIEQRTSTGTWQPTQFSLGTLAPNSDIMAYLPAARNISAGERDQRGGIDFTRYTFTIDRYALAENIRAELIEENLRRGLPPRDIPLTTINEVLNIEAHGELWIGQDGLPIRQIINMIQHDTQKGVSHASVITTDFSGFPAPPAWRATWQTVAALDWQSISFSLAMLALMLALLPLLLQRRLHRPVYAIVAPLIALIMVFSPLLSIPNTAAAAANTAATSPASSAEPALPPAPAPIPGTVPTTPAPAALAAQTTTSTDTTDADQDGVARSIEDKYGSSDTSVDTDGDGLRDSVEIFELGTRPGKYLSKPLADQRNTDGADTDSDGIKDNIEIRPLIGPDGRTWYLDPFKADTNDDGIVDLIDCYGLTNPQFTAACTLDSDKDNLPDAFDADNDNDGLPDRYDAAPYHVVGGPRNSQGQISPLPNQMLQFDLEGQQQNTLLTVEFTLTPHNPKHLWYSQSILDWPTNDKEGQIQRVKDDPLGSSGKLANGDMRLVPMLEIELPYTANTMAGLPRKPGVTLTDIPELQQTTLVSPTLLNQWFDTWLDRKLLDSYQIAVRPKDTSRTMMVYIPLDLMRDPQTDEPMAFTTKMAYRPITTQLIKQKARLAWMVNVKTDKCTKQSSKECELAANWASNGTTIAHTYYDDFVLSALNVHQDKGVKVASIVQRAEATNGHATEQHLWNLADRLGRAFLGGRQDFTIDTLKNRFDQRSNSSATAAQRWNLPSDAFLVDVQTFATQSDISQLMMRHLNNGVERNPLIFDLLNTAYPANQRTANQTMANILFVQEKVFNSTGMEGAAAINATTGEIKYTISKALAPEEQVQRVINWAPVRYQGSDIWKDVAFADYLKDQTPQIDTLLKNNPQNNLSYTSEQRRAGLALLQNLYLAYAVGHSRVVKNGTTWSPQYARTNDADLQINTPAPAASFNDLISSMAISLRPNDPSGLLNDIGRSILYADRASSLAALGQLGTLAASDPARTMQLVAAQTLANFVVSAPGLPDMSESLKNLNVVTDRLSLLLIVVTLVLEVLSAVAKEVVDVLKVSESASRSLANGAKIVIVLVVVVELIAFAARLFAILNNPTLSGEETRAEIADAVADLIGGIAVIVILVALGPAGLVIGIIDAIIALICFVSDFFTERSSLGEFICRGIAGNVAKLIGAIIFSAEPVVDLEESDRINPTNWAIAPVNQEQGFRVGNQLKIQTDVVTTINATWSARTRTIDGFFNDGFGGFAEVLAFSTIRYAFTTQEETGDQRLHKRKNLEREQMKKEWKEVYIERDGQVDQTDLRTTQTISISLPLQRPGINWNPDQLYLAEGYALPAMRCGILIICIQATSYESVYLDIAKSMKFDIFPPNLDAFFSMTDRGNGGFALAWDPQFPVLKDADGDGLRSTGSMADTSTAQNLDPNDSNPDTDNDGLSDFYERNNAAQGFDPTRADTDGDGLNDREEALLDLNPANADIDGDGLNDYDEIRGWEIVYGYENNRPLRFKTGSNPRLADTDSDGILDRQERTYGFNPRAPNKLEVLRINTQINERDTANDGFVRPGATVGYTSQITNTLRDRYALGLYEAELPPEASSTQLPPTAYLLGPQQNTTISGNINIANVANSTTISVTNRAGAIIADLRGLTGGRSIWLKLDELSNSTSLRDSSLFDQHAQCATSNACPDTGIVGYNGNGIKIGTKNGSKTALRIPANAGLSTNRFTLIAWIKPNGSGGFQDMITRQVGAGNKTTYSLSFDNNTLKPRLAVQNQACTSFSTATSSTALTDRNWNMVAATYDGSRLRIFTNGVLSAEVAHTGELCNAANAPLLIGSALNDGAELDELSIYPFALTQSEITSQFRAPLIQLNFDGQVSDSSQFKQSIKPGFIAPIFVGGRASQAASFDKRSWLDVAPNAELDLSRGNGNYTQAAWIRPQPLKPDFDRWIGIIGKDDGSNTYPMIEANFGEYGAGRLRAVFGNGITRCESMATGQWFDRDSWQHIALTFDGSNFRFYRNGELRETIALPAACASNPRPASGNSFSIGRTSQRSFFKVLEIKVFDEADASLTAEYYAEWDDTNFWSRNDIDKGDGTDGCGGGCYQKVGETRFFTDDNTHTYELWEDDDFTGDDRLVSERIRNIDVTWNSYSTFSYAGQWNYNGDGEGRIWYQVWNDFFHGDLDDLQIYRLALSQAEIATIANADGKQPVAQLRLDEPPTATFFRDGSGNLNHGLCSGDSCPTSGIPGRDGQTARFNGQQAVIIADRPTLDTVDGLTVSAWVKLENVINYQQVVSKFDDTKGGYILGVKDGKIYAQLKDEKGGLYTLTGGSILANTWTHLAITATGGGQFIAYINGQEADKKTLPLNGRRPLAVGMPLQNPRSAILFDGYRLAVENEKIFPIYITGDWYSLNMGGDKDGRDKVSSVDAPDSCLDLFDSANHTQYLATVCGTAPSLDTAGANDRTNSVRFFADPATTQNGSLRLNHLARQFVKLPSSLLRSPDFKQITLAASVNTTANNMMQIIVSRGRNDSDHADGTVDSGFRFYLTAQNRLAFSAAGRVWVGDRVLSANQEHHVAVTLDGSNVNLFVNGNLDKTFAFNSTISDVPREDILVGRGPQCGGGKYCDFFSGSIKNLSIYSAGLNSTEIRDLSSSREVRRNHVVTLPFDDPHGSRTFAMVAPAPLVVNDQPLVIGRASASNQFFAKGLIDEVEVRAAELSAAEVQALAQQSPIVNLNLDERLNATNFVNQASGNPNATCNGATCPKPGIKGRIREALVFDGIDDQLELANTLPDIDHFTFELWAMPRATKTSEQPLIIKGRGWTNGNTPSFALTQAANSFTLNLRLTEAEKTYQYYVATMQWPYYAILSDILPAASFQLTGQRSLNANQWNHIVATYDGDQMRLYVNGTLDVSRDTPRAATQPGAFSVPKDTLVRTTDPLRLGRSPNDSQPFAGLLDEVQIYRRALNAAEVKTHYDYQEAWFDVSPPRNLTIDSDLPTIELQASNNGIIKGNATTVLAALPFDPTSPIRTVEYNLGTAWQLASQDERGNWTFGVNPGAANTFTVKLRTTDSVGNVSAEQNTLLNVDGAPPTLVVAPQQYTGQRAVVKDANGDWKLPISGNVNDASEVRKLTITLYDSTGAPVSIAERANIRGAWTETLTFNTPATGRYSVAIEAIDAFDQRATLNGNLTLDSSAPNVTATIGTNRLGGSTQVALSRVQTMNPAPIPMFQGTIGESGAPNPKILALNFEANGLWLDGSPNQQLVRCSDPACPTPITAGNPGSAISFDGIDDTAVVSTTLYAPGQVPNVTLSFRVKPQRDVVSEGLIETSAGVTTTLQFVISNNTLVVYDRALAGATPLLSAPITPNIWNHVALSFNDQELALYIDGVVKETTPYTTFLGFNLLRIGRVSPGESQPDRFFQGAFDDLMVFDRSLTANEIDLLANPIASDVQKVEIRLVHLKDRDQADTLVWQTATLDQSNRSFTTWSFPVPNGIEGPYHLDMRTTDSHGNQQIYIQRWSGDIDTLAPRVAYLPYNYSGVVRVVCVAEDYNLDQAAIQCPTNSALAFGYQNASWYRQYFGNTPRIYSVRTSGDYNNQTPRLRACDTFGNCAESNYILESQTLPAYSKISIPTTSILVDSFDPIQVEGVAHSAVGLTNLDVTAGTIDLSQLWYINNGKTVAWAAKFTPNAEGTYPLQATMIVSSTYVYTDTNAPVVTVDLAAPTLAVPTTVLTSTALTANGIASIGGFVTETHGLSTLEARFGTQPWQTLPRPSAGTNIPFTGTLRLGAVGPWDNVPVNLELRAADIVNKQTSLTVPLTLDTQAPQTANLDIEPSTTQARISGQVSDGSGVRSVEVGLRRIQDADPNQTVWHLATLQNPQTTNSNWIFSINASADRSYVVSLRTTDIHGNQEQLAAVWTGDLFKFAPSFTSTAPAAGTYGVPYDHRFTASGDPTIQFVVTSGSLPPGLNLDPDRGTLSGTPTQAGSYSFTLTAASAWTPDATQNVTLLINKAALAISIADQSRNYGQPNPTLGYTITSGLINGDSVTVVTGVPTTTASITSAAGSYPITAGTLTAANYTLNITNGSLTINKALLTITANNQTRNTSQPNPTLTARYQGFVNGENETVLTTAPVLNTSADAASLAGDYPISLTGAAADNYQITNVDGTLTVTDKEVPSITWSNPAAIVYGTPLSAAQLNATAVFSGTPVAGTFSYDPPAGTVLRAGANQPLRVVFSPTDSATYATVEQSVTIDVSKAPLAVTISDVARSYGTPNPTFNSTISSGLVNGDTDSVLLGTPTTSATQNSSVGSYPITAGTLAAVDYQLNVTTGMLTVTKPTLTISANNVNRRVGRSNPPLTLRYQGFVNGESAANLTTLPTITTSADPNLVGTYPISVSGALATNYEFVYQPGTLTISAKDLPLIDWNTPAAIVYGTALDATQLNATARFGIQTVAGTFSYTPAAGTVLPAGQGQTLRVTFTPADTFSYGVVSKEIAINVDQAPLTVAIDNPSRAYGATNPTLSYRVTAGLVNNDTASVVTGVPTTTATLTTPVGAATIYRGSLSAANYQLSVTPGMLTITPAELVATADNQVRRIGQPNPALTISYSGFANGETSAVLNTLPIATTTAITDSVVATYPITVSGGSASNYTLRYVAGVLTVTNKLVPVVNWNTPATIVYGTPLTNGQLNATATDNGQPVAGSFSYDPPAGTILHVGNAQTLKVTFTPNDQVNYVAVDQSVAISVTKAPLTVTIDDQVSTYGSSLPTLTISANSEQLRGDDTTSVINGTPSTTANSASPIGQYPILAGTLASADYALTIITGTLWIEPALLTVMIDDKQRKIYQANPELTFSYSGFVNNENATVVTGAPTITTTAEMDSPVGPYPVTTTTNGAAPNYQLIARKGTLTVLPKDLPIIRWSSPEAISYGTALSATQLNATAWFANQPISGTFSYDPPLGSVLNAGNQILRVQFTPDDSATFAGVSAETQIAVRRAPLQITIGDATRVYGANDPTVAYTVTSGLINGDTSSVVQGTPTPSADPTSPVGQYAISIGSLVADNYELVVTEGVLTITKARLTATAADLTRRVGRPNPTATILYTGLLNTDKVEDLDLLPTATISATVNSPIGQYPIQLAGGNDNNYDFVYVEGTLNVVDRDVPSIAWNTPTAITYGTALGTTQLNATASFNGQPVSGSFSYTPANGMLLKAGNGQILNLLFTPDDQINFAPVSLQVTIDVRKAPLTVTATNQRMKLGAALPTLSYTITGFVNGDNAAMLDTPIQISATPENRVGVYPIVVSGGLDNDYELVFVNGALSVAQDLFFPFLVVR
jgi:hypothetical protein